MSKITQSRRAFARSSLFGLFTFLFTRTGHSTAPQTPDFELAFSAIVDTFVPRDAFPGALDLGIDQQLLTQITGSKHYREQIQFLLNALYQLAEQEFAKSFEILDLENRSLLISQAMKSNATDKATRLGLHSLQIKTLNAFYTSETAFRMLDYHPPSEGGYPDYARPLSELYKS